jgi:hypothetical protein
VFFVVKDLKLQALAKAAAICKVTPLPATIIPCPKIGGEIAAGET